MLDVVDRCHVVDGHPDGAEARNCEDGHYILDAVAGIRLATTAQPVNCALRSVASARRYEESAPYRLTLMMAYNQRPASAERF
jgi:hypothetical protein